MEKPTAKLGSHKMAQGVPSLLFSIVIYWTGQHMYTVHVIKQAYCMHMQIQQVKINNMESTHMQKYRTKSVKNLTTKA